MAIINQVVSGGGGSAPQHYVEKSVDANGVLQSGAHFIDLTGVTSIAANALSNAYYGSSISGAIDMSGITTITGDNACVNMCRGSSGITSVDMSSLVTLSGTLTLTNAFMDTGVTSFDLSSLETISGTSCLAGTFTNTPVTSASFPALKNISSSSGMNNCFKGCTSLTTVVFDVLETVQSGWGNMCEGCTALTTFSCPELETVTGNAFSGNIFTNATIQTLNLPKLKTVSGSQAFYQTLKNKSGFTGTFSLPKLETASGSSAFSEFAMNSGITGIDFPLLKTIGSGTSCFSSAFQNCAITGIVTFPSLESVTGQSVMASMLAGSTQQYTRINFPSLNTLTGSAALFRLAYAVSTITEIWFYALTPSSFGSNTNQFTRMLENDTGVTVHFPMAIQATIGSWTDVTGGFGGTNTTVLFDVVTSLTGADTNTYARSQKDSTSTATAWLYNDTLYYTSGVNEPAVSDTIYSDSACTTAVTTISAIA